MKASDKSLKITVLEAASAGPDVSFSCLGDFGTLEIFERTEDRETAAERLRDTDIAVIDTFPMDAVSLAGAEKLRFITMTSTGTDSIDFAYTNSHGIAVSNIRNYSTHSVAQHTFAMLLSLYENLESYQSFVRDGKYRKGSGETAFYPFPELYGKTYGIVGLGSIGKEVAAIAAAFGCRVIWYSPSGHGQDVPYEQVDFEDLLRESDIISLHCPLTEKTAGLFGAAAFRQMKDSALLINSARGGVVDESALADALRTGQIRAAGLDVLSEEPMRPDSPFIPLLNAHAQNLLITPHIGWASVESRTRAVHEVYENIRAFLAGEERNRCGGFQKIVCLTEMY